MNGSQRFDTEASCNRNCNAYPYLLIYACPAITAPRTL